MLKNRIRKLRAQVKTDTQKMREDALQNLQELFNMAKTLAQNNTLKITQRQNWTRVATYICQVINSVAQTFDEKQIDQDLEKLETLINEATTKNQTQTTATTNP
jgi:predicted ArsR family transcriptional regulator